MKIYSFFDLKRRMYDEENYGICNKMLGKKKN